MIHSSNKIVVPIDFSEQSLIALEKSYNIAREYHAEITLFQVLSIRPLPQKDTTIFPNPN